MSWTDYTDYLTSHNVCSASAVLNGDTGGLVAGNNFSVPLLLLLLHIPSNLPQDIQIRSRTSH